MIYDLPQISEQEFTNFHSYVQSVFDLGRQRFSPELTRITTQNSGFDPGHMEYIAKDQALAVTLENRGDRQSKFQIWVSPSYKEPSFRFYVTLAHELVHGYAGLKYGHNSHWRRWFYRVMWHLNQSAMVPEPESGLALVCFETGIRYNYTSARSEINLLEEAFAKAEQQHDQVVENYWKRINAESRNRI